MLRGAMERSGDTDPPSLSREEKGVNDLRGPPEEVGQRPTLSFSSSPNRVDCSPPDRQQSHNGQQLESRSPPQVDRGRVLVAILRNPENSPVIKKFLLFAACLAVLPVATLFLLPGCLVRLAHALQYDTEGLDNSARTWSCIASVAVVNVVMLAYAYLAYEEEKRDWEAVSQGRGKGKDQGPGPECKKLK